MKKLTLFFIMFTGITTIQGSTKQPNNPTKKDLLLCIVTIATNERPGSIVSKNGPYFKFLRVHHCNLPNKHWSLSAHLHYPEMLRFRDPNKEEKTSIFHNRIYCQYCENDEKIETSDISQALMHQNIPPHLFAVITSIVHCTQGGQIISDPATKRSIEIWNDRGEITKIE